jgi:hypothetical protein
MEGRRRPPTREASIIKWLKPVYIVCHLIRKLFKVHVLQRAEGPRTAFNQAGWDTP